MNDIYEAPNSISKYQFLYHFVPHKHKKIRARLLSNRALILYALVQIALVAIIRVVPLFAPGILGYASNINSQDLLKYTNETRAKVGLKPLSMNQELSEAAQSKAQDMFKVGYWAHVSPMGTKPWDFILDQDYDYVYAGENLAKNFSNSKDVVEAWYTSPSHRDNLLSSNYDDIGFAVINGVIDGYETTIVVQMFGRERVATKLASESVNAPEVPAKVEEEITPIEVPEPVIEEAPEVPAKVAQNVEGEATPILQQLSESKNIVEEKFERNELFVDVKSATRSITYTFGGFVVALLCLDLWYSKKHGILKVTGHTFAHIIFLALVLMSVMLSIVPGAIL